MTAAARTRLAQLPTTLRALAVWFDRNSKLGFSGYKVQDDLRAGATDIELALLELTKCTKKKRT